VLLEKMAGNETADKHFARKLQKDEVKSVASLSSKLLKSWYVRWKSLERLCIVCWNCQPVLCTLATFFMTNAIYTILPSFSGDFMLLLDGCIAGRRQIFL
jgi:hypothetical protein